ncbi:MAG TPA: histidine kinase [Candidatus Kryptonia bacterium]|nr:histidine kinase [Candidatus Kryptonia bacterium]
MSTPRQGAKEVERRAIWGGTTMRSEHAFRQQLLFIYGTGLAFGLHLGLIHLYLFRSPQALVTFTIATLAFSSLTLVLWKWVLPWFSSWPRVWRLAAQVVTCTLAVTLLSVITTEGNAAVFGGLSLLRPYSGGDIAITIHREALQRAPLIYTLIPIGPTVLLCVVGFNQHWWRILMLEGRERELRELAVSAQLAALRAQLNPHFFFNSLNSIAQLISTDPAKAEACVERLAEIFRYMLRRGHTEFVPLQEELEIAEAYLEIERARFGDDLLVEERIDERARQVRLPELILQPLVENAVKHGVSRKIGGGRVSIEAAFDNGDLRLTVADTGAGIQNSATIFESGVGLKNVRARLLRLYGPEYEPVVTSAAGRGTSVTLRIPVVATA